MSDPLLPQGIKISACIDTEERSAVRIDLALDGCMDKLVLVLPPHQAHAAGLLCLDQEDCRVRTLGALLIRQAKLAEERSGQAWGLRLVGGSES